MQRGHETNSDAAIGLGSKAACSTKTQVNWSAPATNRAVPPVEDRGTGGERGKWGRIVQ